MAGPETKGTDSATLPSSAGAASLRDEHGEIIWEFVARVALAVDDGRKDDILALAGNLHESDLGSLLEALDPEQRLRLIDLMGDEFDFAALTEVEETVRGEILEELATQTIAEGLHELESDDALTILEDLPKDEQAEVLESLPAGERITLQRSLDYPEESAGRLMQTTMVTAPPFWSAGQTLDYIHDVAEDEIPEEFFEVFVVDPGHRFMGNVFLDALVRARRTQTLQELMNPDRRRVRATDDQEEVARVFERYNLVSVPVVDEGDRLLGVITIDDIVDVIQQEADEDVKALGGVRASEELSDRVGWVARSRFAWLFINLVTAFAAAYVISLFEGQIQKMVALAVLVPIVASQGGNAATQTMTVAVRALATRELSDTSVKRFLRRELLVGLVNGFAFGLITGVAASLWYGMPMLGLVIALAMVINLSAAAIAGMLVPLALDRLGYDPAVSSGTFVTTVTDIVGNLTFLGIATLLLRLV
jgi:magnesium transporter